MKIRIFWLSWISLLLSIVSCNPSHPNTAQYQEPNHNPYILQPGRKFQAQTKTIHLDSVDKPDPILLTKERIDPGDLVSYPIKTHTQNATEPKSYPITTETFPGNPQPAELAIKEAPLKWPKWEEANLIFQEGGKNNFSYLDVNRGLKSNFVFSLLEDSKGNIWMGTWGGWVSEWDEKSFKHLRKENGVYCYTSPNKLVGMIITQIVC